MKQHLSTLIFFSLFVPPNVITTSIPIVLNTWNFSLATQKGWEALQSGSTPIEALVAGCSKCEELQCDGSVGFGGSPDENGETTQDALIFDGSTMDMGAVGGLRRIRNAISVAKYVLQYTKHSLLTGSLATEFAVHMGFKEESLSTNKSSKMHKQWLANNCQRNFWKNVNPDPHKFCGPYKPDDPVFSRNKLPLVKEHHDTIGMIAIDKNGNIAAGTSTNGANHKIPGRVGDSPIPGAGAYADNEFGAAVATGDGDVMMRFLPSFLAVEQMRRGKPPTLAAQISIDRVHSKYPDFFGAVLVVNAHGQYGAACSGMDTFPFCIMNGDTREVKVEHIHCAK